ncbi:polyprenyl synthetase family protein [uncultured Eudoraea sp.]|uniref:polyprenyl synthetase family protein n=1 Tax=uncultured Eudoraea sp. TaxID=1035614 RepID=UPI0026210286|nr:polyprenyl synthetase family protein [uncultured Eudoraea sp.]
MLDIEFFRNGFNAYLEKKLRSKDPLNLYEPITYIMDLGGKRLRPILTLISTDVFGGNYEEAMDAALAIEVFHNFSLVHDDIMDAAPLRRGEKTVHKKWDINTGILSGDVMLINSYQYFESYPPELFKSLLNVFSKTAIEVCEGQQYDMDFNTGEDVTIPDYLKMITYKTAVLVAAALKMGAIISNASLNSQDAIYDYGINLGIAFQLQDDYLDAFGDPETFGKQVGGDIIENKKTFLYLKSIELGTEDQINELKDLFSIKPANPNEKVETVKEIYIQSGAVEIIKMEIKNYTQHAFKLLKSIEAPENKKELLEQFGNKLMNREV